MSGTRRTFTAKQKAEVVRRHLRDKVPVSELAEELSIQPSQIHQWVNTLLSQAEQAFTKGGRQDRRRLAKQEDARNQRIKKLEAKLDLKNEVIAELMEENVKAKKANGDL